MSKVSSPERVTIERTFADATVEEVWEMWTTKAGIEAWWGPDGFSVKVLELDVRPGGILKYAMSAIQAEHIEFMKKAGMPNTTETSGRYTVVEPPIHLTFTQLADFIPNVEPYTVTTSVELQQIASGVRLVLTIDRMHDAYWTEMAVKGWESELGKLAKALAA